MLVKQGDVAHYPHVDTLSNKMLCQPQSSKKFAKKGQKFGLKIDAYLDLGKL